MELKVDDDGLEASRLDAIETLLGLMFVRMQRDAAHDIIAEVRHLARASDREPDILPESIRALDRLANLLEQYARSSPKLRTVPAGAKPESGDAQ